MRQAKHTHGGLRVQSSAPGHERVHEEPRDGGGAGRGARGVVRAAGGAGAGEGAQGEAQDGAGGVHTRVVGSAREGPGGEAEGGGEDEEGREDWWVSAGRGGR